MLKENRPEYKLHDAEDYDTSEDCVLRTQENLLAALSYSIHEEIGELDIRCEETIDNKKLAEDHAILWPHLPNPYL